MSFFGGLFLIGEIICKYAYFVERKNYCKNRKIKLPLKILLLKKMYENSMFREFGTDIRLKTLLNCHRFMYKLDRNTYPQGT